MSDRERLICPACQLEYWWPGQAWKHEQCKAFPPQVEPVPLPAPEPDLGPAGAVAQSGEHLVVNRAAVEVEPASPAKWPTYNEVHAKPKFDRSAVMKARWAERKAKGETVL